MPDLAYAIKLEFPPKHAKSVRSGKHHAERERTPERIRLPDGMLMASSSLRLGPPGMVEQFTHIKFDNNS